MVSLEKRIEAFSVLGKELNKLSGEEWNGIVFRANQLNPWFRKEDIERAFQGIIEMLSTNHLEQWLSNYGVRDLFKRVGLVMAGNIPAVGFHDYLSILISGNKAIIKLSSQDSILLQYIHSILKDIAPDLANNAEFVDRLNMDELNAVIATGSDNSARYFESYFSAKPNIIRKNRTSVAILNGNETQEELLKLGHDVLDYYGLGCRNVSKLLVPMGYDFISFFDTIQALEGYAMAQTKYVNNYDYNKAIYLVNGDKHLDNGFLLITESKELVSPIAVLFYEEYEGIDSVELDEEKIQCKVGEGGLPFGQAQCPLPWDYADGVDVIDFVNSIE